MDEESEDSVDANEAGSIIYLESSNNLSTISEGLEEQSLGGVSSTGMPKRIQNRVQ